jgi:hypothetical protein
VGDGGPKLDGGTKAWVAGDGDEDEVEVEGEMIERFIGGVEAWGENLVLDDGGDVGRGGGFGISRENRFVVLSDKPAS